jgi:hypothetical protein
MRNGMYIKYFLFYAIIELECLLRDRFLKDYMNFGPIQVYVLLSTLSSESPGSLLEYHVINITEPC